MSHSRRWLAAGLLLALGIGTGAWWWSLRGPSEAAVAVTPVGTGPAAALETGHASAATAPAAEALIIGEYRPDAAGLPPLDAPLATQIPELRAAAAKGNATAACRLAEIGLQCAFSRPMPAEWPEDPAFQRNAEAELLRLHTDTNLDALPENLRDYAQRRLESDGMAELDSAAVRRAWQRRCQGAPDVDPSETMALLRQAALAGEPRSMVRYAYADWMIYFIGAASFGGFGREGPGMAWTRAPAFDQWRREALAVRRAGLERGDPEMLQRAINPPIQQALRPLGATDPVEFASALRAHASLVTGRTPESTAALGLPPGLAAEADRLSDAWAARSRERGRSVDEALLGPRESAEVPACE